MTQQTEMYAIKASLTKDQMRRLEEMRTLALARQITVLTRLDAEIFDILLKGAKGTVPFSKN